GVRVKSQGCHIGIVSRESIRHRLSSGAMILRMQNRRFLPKSSLCFQRNDITFPVIKRILHLIGDPGSNNMMTDGTLVRQRSEFHFDRSPEVAKSLLLCCWIVEQEDRRM